MDLRQIRALNQRGLRYHRRMGSSKTNAELLALWKRQNRIEPERLTTEERYRLWAVVLEEAIVIAKQQRHEMEAAIPPLTKGKKPR